MRAIYLFLIAAMVGVELVLGIVVAPVVFYPQNFIGEGVLSHFQSGVLMTQIFVKMGYILLIVSTVAILYEGFSFFKKDDGVGFRLKFSKFALSFLIFILSLIFVFYFSAYIVNAQSMGESAMQSQEFLAMHEASEVVIKMIAMMQIFLFFLSFKIAKKG